MTGQYALVSGSPDKKQSPHKPNKMKKPIGRYTLEVSRVPFTATFIIISVHIIIIFNASDWQNMYNVVDHS